MLPKHLIPLVLPIIKDLDEDEPITVKFVSLHLGLTPSVDVNGEVIIVCFERSY